MNEVSITIDQNLKYTIELQEEYDAKEFISTIEGHLVKVKKLFSSEPDIFPKNRSEKSGGHTLLYQNDLFKKLNKLIGGLGNDIGQKDGTTMRTFTSIMKSINKKRGLAWLKPVGNSLIIYLRLGDHSDLDARGKIIYSEPGRSTFGNYPMMQINKGDDIEYAFNIIKNIYSAFDIKTIKEIEDKGEAPPPTDRIGGIPLKEKIGCDIRSHLKKYDNDGIVQIFKAMCQKIKEIDTKRSYIKVTKDWLNFYPDGSKEFFICTKIQKSSIHVGLKIKEKLDDPRGKTKPSNDYGCDYIFKIDPLTDLDYSIFLINQAYDQLKID